MAKWGTYPPDEQLRLKRDAAEELYEALSELRDLMQAVYEGEYTPDSFTNQPADAALAKARGAA